MYYNIYIKLYCISICYVYHIYIIQWYKLSHVLCCFHSPTGAPGCTSAVWGWVVNAVGGHHDTERIPVWLSPMLFGGWLNKLPILETNIGKSWGSFHEFIEPPSFCWWFGSEKKHISMFWAFLICHINLQSNFGGNPGKKNRVLGSLLVGLSQLL